MGDSVAAAKFAVWIVLDASDAGALDAVISEPTAGRIKNALQRSMGQVKETGDSEVERASAIAAVSVAQKVIAFMEAE